MLRNAISRSDIQARDEICLETRAIGGPVDAVSNLTRPPRRRAARRRHRAIETVFYGSTSACTLIRVIPGDPAPKYSRHAWLEDR